MAKFSTCIRIKRNDGLYPVYISVSHNGATRYIKTHLLVNDKGLRTVYSKTGKELIEIIDKMVLKECMGKISAYAERMNAFNSSDMTCKMLVEILTDNTTEISFTEYANKVIADLKNQWRDSTANNYSLAVSSLKKYLGRDNIMFNELTTKVLSGWIESMKDSARKKSAYPSCVRSIFNRAIEKYNDYDYDIIRVRNPFVRVKIPKERVPEKRSVEAGVIKSILEYTNFNADDSRKELARDVAALVFCLAGINVADLYDMNESSLKEWKLCYNRKKTRNKSDTGAYMEITVPKGIRPLFEKYKGINGKLFNFSKRYSIEKNFLKNVNTGLKAICNEIGIEETITTYVFRHSWATIAQNNCGASTELVAFSLNHSSAHKITEGYIRKDYSPIDKLNEQVIDFVFQSR